MSLFYIAFYIQDMEMLKNVSIHYIGTIKLVSKLQMEYRESSESHDVTVDSH